MKPILVADYSWDSFLIHWLILEKECPLDVVYPHQRYDVPLFKGPYYHAGDILIYDHAALVQFLQERYPGEQLLPADPVSRAQVRQACAIVSDPEVDLAAEVAEIVSTGSTYMTGRDFTLLDIYVGTRLSTLQEIPPAIADYWKRIISRPAYKVALS